MSAAAARRNNFSEFSSAGIGVLKFNENPVPTPQLDPNGKYLGYSRSGGPAVRVKGQTVFPIVSGWREWLILASEKELPETVKLLVDIVNVHLRSKNGGELALGALLAPVLEPPVRSFAPYCPSPSLC